MILYEYPLNESTRTLLRLERLNARLELLTMRDAAVDHHHALLTLFEMLEVLGRSDLKGDLMRELDKQKVQLEAYRGNPAVAAAALDEAIGRFSQAFSELNQLSGKLGSELLANDWLMSIRSRSAIPGGCFEFDLPSYHAWLHQAPDERRSKLKTWAASLKPVVGGASLLLNLVRESGSPVRAAAPGGQFQQSLPQGKSYQMLRLQMEAESGLVPEITGHRLMVSIRFMKQDEQGRYKPAGEDATFEFALCS